MANPNVIAIKKKQMVLEAADVGISLGLLPVSVIAHALRDIYRWNIEHYILLGRIEDTIWTAAWTAAFLNREDRTLREYYEILRDTDKQLVVLVTMQLSQQHYKAYTEFALHPHEIQEAIEQNIKLIRSNQRT